MIGTVHTGSVVLRLNLFAGGFQSIEHVLIVGVGGGVPHYADASRHVRLGDVVVSVSQDSTEPTYVYCDSVQRNRVTKEVLLPVVCCAVVDASFVRI